MGIPVKLLTVVATAAASVMVCVSGLTGCSGSMGFPDTVVTTQSALGTIQGNDYGGHAPIVGAELFVVQVGTKGYGTAVTDLLGASYSDANYPTQVDNTPGSVTNGMYYIRTGAGGSFDVTGDYTCTAGYPVYLYATGGNQSSAVSTTLSSFSITGNVVTFTTASQTLAAGESVNIAGAPSAYSYLNGTYAVSATGRTAVSFQVPLTHANVLATTLSSGTVTANNPAIANVALLGNCPTPPATFASTLKFVYMNEVSTVAAMQVLAPFANTTTNNDALHIGTSPTNLAGLQAAVLTANNLYDIQGSSGVGTGTQGGAHIARATTAAGNGTVPYQLIDALGNSLAGCVDSANTYSATTAPSGAESTQCKTLFANATANGTTTGTKPNDIATVMLNIAHYPTGVGNTAFAANIYNQGGSSQPFLPALTATPTDLSVGINYTDGSLNGPIAVALDGASNVWVANSLSNTLSEFNNLGVVQSGTNGFSGGGLSAPNGIAIDTSGNAWVSNQNGSGLSEFSSAGSALSGNGGYTGGGLNGSYDVAIDGKGQVWATVPNSNALAEFSATGTAISGAGGVTGGGLNQPYGLAIDGGNNVWAGNYVTLSKFTNTGAPISGNGGYGGGGQSYVVGIAADSSNNLWTSNASNNSLSKLSNTGAAVSGNGGYTGGGLNVPYDVAVDGAGRVFAVNQNGSSISEFSSTGTAISSTNAYQGGAMNTPYQLAIDESGNIWVPNYGSNTVTEMVGVATPVVTPMAASLTTPYNKPAAAP